ncbi:hypothetical protein NDU88_007735 [Pleurodeles waltl]|uniref:Uncharacterized protein n=1 Tax=Pleurodeles waltl TaxID=8319 RepID=A0AAV7NU03_PLEWA|nr:hypothetical protein NDU88_007735 [Pleurodeles waltl]
MNLAYGTSEWRLPRGVHGEKDGLPCYLGNEDAGTSLGNPDIRVPSRTKREDGLPLRNEEDAEKPGRKENGKDTEDEERKEDDDSRRNGNSVVPTETADHRGTERNGDTRTDRHAPRGTWLTKIRHIPGALQGPADFLSCFLHPSVLYQSQSWDGVCSRLSMNPAHDASEWRLPRGVRGEKNGLPCYLGNEEAGTCLGNLDIRVPSRTKREDGLPLRNEEDAEKP